MTPSQSADAAIAPSDILLASGQAGEAPVVVDLATDSAGMQAVQVIIKFDAMAGEPVPAARLDRIAQETGVKLQLLRPMSGGALVLTMQYPASEPLADVLQRLRRQPGVRYVEEDALMQSAPAAAAPPGTAAPNPAGNAGISLSSVTTRPQAKQEASNDRSSGRGLLP